MVNDRVFLRHLTTHNPVGRRLMLITSIFRRPSTVSVICSTILMAVSLTPSLIPRPWIDQMVISALSFACGYAIGVIVSALRRYLERLGLPQRCRASAPSPRWPWEQMRSFGATARRKIYTLRCRNDLSRLQNRIGLARCTFSINRAFNLQNGREAK